MIARRKIVPLGLKISAILIATVGICLSIAGAYSYSAISSKIERMLGLRLEHIARTAALMVPGDLHERIVEDWMHQEPGLTETPEFIQIQKTLRAVRAANELSSDIYTLIRPEFSPDQMVFITMANAQPYVGNGVKAHEKAIEVLQRNVATHSALYEDQEGFWVSGFAPVKNSEGKVVAVLEVDYRADQEVADAKAELVRHLGIPALGSILISLVLGGLSGRSISEPLRKLVSVTQEIGKGDFTVRAEIRSRDEVFLLGEHFNLMIEQLQQSHEALASYSKDLERMVEERTAKLREAGTTIRAMLESLGQGFFVANRAGRCLGIHSKACEKLLEGTPEGKDLWDVLRQPRDEIEPWWDLLFEDRIPFEDMVESGPKTFPHSNNLQITLDYHKLLDEQGGLQGIMVVATDRTAEFKAEEAMNREKQVAQQFLKLVRQRNEFATFVRDARDLFDLVKKETEKGSYDRKMVARTMHTLKGGSASFLLHDIAEMCHEAESLVLQTSNEPTPLERAKIAEAIAEISDRFERFLEERRDLLGSQVLSGGRVVELGIEDLYQFSTQLTAVPQLQRQFVNTFVSEPVLNFLKPFDELLSQLSGRLGKRVMPLIVEGGDIRVLARRYSRLFGELVHVFRNALDHGIETPDERLLAGKDGAGLIRMEFVVFEGQENPQLRLTITDDGRGVDPNEIREVLRSYGRTEEAARLRDHEVIQCIFESGFSSRREISDISGRGVGLSAVWSECKRMGGEVWVSSLVGKGTSIIIEVPYLL